MSLTLGNGVFGGLLPVVGLTVCAATGSIYAGLAYPIVIALVTVVVGTKFLPETKNVRIWDELHATDTEPATPPSRVPASVGSLAPVAGD